MLWQKKFVKIGYFNNVGGYMSNLLVWSLQQDLKLVFHSPQADLGTITCCDLFEIVLLHGDVSHLIVENMTGCMLSSLKQILEQLVSDQRQAGRFHDNLLFGRDLVGHCLVEIRRDQRPLSYNVVDIETLRSWIAQLDLLQVVMEENENEKKSRGTSCCG